MIWESRSPGLGPQEEHGCHGNQLLICMKMAVGHPCCGKASVSRCHALLSPSRMDLLYLRAQDIPEVTSRLLP